MNEQLLEKDGKQICYRTMGDQGKPALILIGGISSQLVGWPEDFLRDLLNQGFRVVVFDHRDVGRSSYYDHLETPSVMAFLEQMQQGTLMDVPYSLDDMADDVITLMDGLEIEKSHVLGVSMGGQVAQVLAINHPDRVTHLTLVSTSSADRDLPPPSQEVMGFFFGSQKPITDLESAIERHIAQYKIYNHPDDFDFDEAEKKLTTAYQRAYHPEGFQRQLLAMMAAPPRGDALKQLDVPCLIVHGDYDPVFSMAHAERLADSLSNSDLLAVKDMGHSLPTRGRLLISKNLRL